MGEREREQSVIGSLHRWMVDWEVGWTADWPTGLLTDRLTD